jgi:hypothetical protein
MGCKNNNPNMSHNHFFVLLIEQMQQVFAPAAKLNLSPRRSVGFSALLSFRQQATGA